MNKLKYKRDVARQIKLTTIPKEVSEKLFKVIRTNLDSAIESEMMYYNTDARQQFVADIIQEMDFLCANVRSLELKRQGMVSEAQQGETDE